MAERLKIGSIVIRCFEFDRMLAFWEEALHYVHTGPVEGGWVILRDPEGSGPGRRSGEARQDRGDSISVAVPPR